MNSSPTDRVARVVRAGLIGSGGTGTLLTLLALALRVHRGGPIGPTQLHIGAIAVAILIAGLLRAPARVLAQAFMRARAGAPVEIEPVTRRQRGLLASAVLVALVFRLVMISVYWPSHQIVTGMVLWDAEMARNLLKGRGWTLNWGFVERLDRVVIERGKTVDPQEFYPVDDSKPGALDTFQLYAHTPGHSVWLALSFLLGGSHRFIYSQWMQAALDSLACLLVFGIGRRLWSNTAGVAGALIYALSPGHVYLAIQPAAAATDSFWVLLIGYGAVRLARAVASRTSVAPGLVAVVAGTVCGTMMNTLAFTLPLAAAGGAALAGFFVRPAWRIAGYLVLAHLLVVLALVPWGLRTKRVYGHFAETRQTFWQHTWETLGAVPNPWGLQLVTESGGKDDAYFVWIRANCPAPCWPFEREAFTRDYLLKNVFTSPQFPVHLLRLVKMQLPGVVYVSRLPVDNPYVGEGIAGRIFAAALSVINVAVLLLFPAALVGLVFLTVRKSTAVAAWVGLAPSVFLIVFSLVLFIEHRKTTQAYGYLMALAGVACAACLNPRDDR